MGATIQQCPNIICFIFSERGLTVHLQSTGYLVASTLSMMCYEHAERFTHDMWSFVMAGTMSTTLPCSSKAGVMSNACNTTATLMNNELSAKCLPGQILETR